MEYSDFPEYTRIVFNRISKIDSENVRKIIGYLLLNDHGDQEMAQLALAPDHIIRELVSFVRTELHLLALRSVSVPPPSPSPSTSAPSFLHLPRNNRHFPCSSLLTWDQQQQLINTNNCSSDCLSFSDPIYELHNPTPYFCFDDHSEGSSSVLAGSGYGYGYECSTYADNAAMINSFSTRPARHYSAGTEFQPKVCHYYNKGFCKHGNSCRYLHSSPSESYNSVYDDHMFRPGTLEKLQFEIVELLKARRGIPISIASLPMIYYENYGRILQAEGYLTESQRHGKSGFSLTKLLTRLKSSILVIDRPHGQHAVILAEDASKYMDNRKNEHGSSVSSARQIYMTFPAESIFTEEDVSEYFSKRYGPVEDVRIPCQQRRMFGFVTFYSTDTVKQIMSDDREHLIAGARVLVKTYREKDKLTERKGAQDKMEQPSPTYCARHCNQLESEHQLHSIQRGYGANRILRLRIDEQQRQQALEAERRLSEMRLGHKSVIGQPCFSYQMQQDDLQPREEQFCSQPTENFDNHDLLEAHKAGPGCSRSHSRSRSSSTDENKLPRNSIEWNHLVLDNDSEYNLPESPFEPQIEGK